MADLNASWNLVRAFMHAQCGLVFEDKQMYLLEARLGPVARRFGHRSLDEYVRETCAPCARAELVSAMVEAMTTHESYFFRDSNYWRAFTDIVLPGALARLQGRPLRIWSSACASGQEPYTIAMLLEETAPGAAESALIYATDVAEETLAFAAEGSYGAHEVNRGVSAARLVRHFEPVGNRFQIKSRLRSRITWEVHNLVKDTNRYRDIDILMCRNVLIYFDDETRCKVLASLSRSLRTGAALGIGVTEQLKWPRLAAGWFERPAV